MFGINTKISLGNIKGTSTVIMALTFSIIAGFAALTIDIGIIFTEKYKLTSAVDSAALAGAQEYITQKESTYSIAQAYVSNNIENTKSVEVIINDDEKTVEVKGVKNVENFFASLIGQDSQDILSRATAKVENISALDGARPLAVVQQNFIYGAQYTLKEGGGDGTTGNYAAIALGGSGGSVYRNNLTYGYSGTIRVNDTIPTETGNIAGITQTCITELVHSCNHIPECTHLSYNKNCSKIIFVPIVNTLDINGKKCIKVLGFATFFLEGVTNNAGQADVIGRFITYSMEGETSADINDYGTYGIKLIH